MPDWKTEIRARLANLHLTPTHENAIVEELAQDLDDCYAELLARGVSEAVAYRQTLAELSESELLQRELRPVERHAPQDSFALGTNRRAAMMAELWQDLRFGARTLLKQKGSTVIAVLSLALGIGANAALFSIVDAMLLKMLPVKEPERLVLFKSLAPREFNAGGYNGSATRDPVTGQQRMTSFPYQSYLRLREQPGALSDVFAFGQVNTNVQADGQAELANGQAVTGNYYAGLGVKAVLGRVLTDDDDKAAARPVVVLSHRYWQKRFNGAASVIGKQINLNNVAFTVIGVTPPGFEGTGDVGTTQDVTISLAWEPQLNVDPQRSRLYGGGSWWLRIMGRLQPGATREQAQAQLANSFQQSVVEHRALRNAQAGGGNPLAPLHPKDYPRLVLDPGGQGEMHMRAYYAPSLYLLLGVVGLVLLIACANVANLLLAQAAMRQKEISVRLALGASRGRLLRQLVTESSLLATVGGVVGLVFAQWIKDSLLAVSDWGPRALDPKLDWRVLTFTLVLSLLTGIIFGLAPAWRATKADLTPTLKDSGRGSSVASRSWLSRGLVVAQVALSLLLLIGAALFVRTLLNLQRVDPGFNTSNLLLFKVRPSLIGYTDEKLTPFYQQMCQRLEAIPGVQKVTFSNSSLLAQSSSNRNFYLRSAWTNPPAADGSIKPTGNSQINQVRENFLEAMEIPLLAGRRLSPQDTLSTPKVVVVNQSFARQFFPQENPVGKRIAFDPKQPDEVEIVGLAKDAKYASQREEIPPTMYVSWRQESVPLGATVEVRTAGEPSTFVAAVRQAMREVDANLPLIELKTQVEQADETLRMERLFAKLVALFGLLAQQLAAIGLFGVLAYTVSQRTQEIGIRMALGASQFNVLKMVMRQGMTLCVIGIVLGLVSACVLTNYLENWLQLSKLLYGIRPTDLATYSAMVLLLTVVAAIACYVPARRATKVDPLIALRSE